MQLTKVNSFPTTIRNWDTLNEIAQAMVSLKAVSPEHSIPASALVEQINASRSNAYKLLREAPGFAPVYGDDGTLTYYYETDQMRKYFDEDMGFDFYPKTFRNVLKLREVQQHATEIHEDGTLYRIRRAAPGTAPLDQRFSAVIAATEAQDINAAIDSLSELISGAVAMYLKLKEQRDGS